METSLSLLDRLAGSPGEADWQRLVSLYEPLLRSWIARAGVPDSDAEDLTQEVLLVVFREVADFQHRGTGAFRGWMRTILSNRLRSYFRARNYRPTVTGDSAFFHRLDELESPESSLSAVWDREHDLHVVSVLLAQVEGYFGPSTFQAFRRYVLEGVAPAQVAQELSLTLNSVLLSKSRVLKRLRQELGRLLD